MRSRTSVALLSLVAAFCCGQALFAAMRVTPAVVELTIADGRASGAFTLNNSADETIRVRATPVHFRVDSTGKLAPAKLDSTSLGRWLKINPQEFTVGSKQDRQIRFAVVAPPNLPDGSYWGGIEFRPVQAADTSSKSQIHAVTAILVPILADQGKPEHRWDLVQDSVRTEITHQGVYVRTLLRNIGNGRIPQRGHYTVKDATGKLVEEGDTPRLSLFPHSERYFATQISEKVPPGAYDFSIVYTSERDEKSTLTGHAKVEVPDALPEPPPPPEQHTK
ncbi:hypothetical protein HZB60_12705 [candidate division KSB1 bacterium]|nr:hypothetical protein [candidate division KSB1 bacterium]